jgi:spermidine synthase
MALIWTKTVGDTRFEVRRAGRSVRLYTNGVFHSQYNPANPISGTVWDLLLLPAFFRPRGTVSRVLVLGVGGGTVIRLLQQYIGPRHITAVELDPVHLYIARRFFGVTQRRAELVEADAIRWLRGYKGPKFDLIVEDLFGEANGEPVRAVEADRSWLATLARNLNSEGILAMNFVSARSLSDAHRTLREKLPNRFDSSFQLTLPAYENAIGAFVSQPATTQQLREALRASEPPRRINLRRLPYRIRRLRN